MLLQAFRLEVMQEHFLIEQWGAIIRQRLDCKEMIIQIIEWHRYERMNIVAGFIVSQTTLHYVDTTI